jgi:hypothetical protein
MSLMRSLIGSVNDIVIVCKLAIGKQGCAETLFRGARQKKVGVMFLGMLSVSAYASQRNRAGGWDGGRRDTMRDFDRNSLHGECPRKVEPELHLSALGEAPNK